MNNLDENLTKVTTFCELQSFQEADWEFADNLLHQMRYLSLVMARFEHVIGSANSAMAADDVCAN